MQLLINIIKMERLMSELMFLIRSAINVVAYFGLFLGIDQELFSSTIIKALQISPILSNLIVIVAIMLWIIKGVWFVYDKFYLERKERLQKLKNN